VNGQGQASELTPDEMAALDEVARFIVRRGLTTPAILFFESVRPLNRMGSVAMTFLEPIAGALFALPRWSRLRDAFERRESIDVLLDRIEALDAEGRG
jgi:hypothetical protein